MMIQMSDEGWDVWEIEMNGGPYTDCTVFDEDTCPNYNYSDLVDYYCPALVAGVMEYSNKNQVNYIGHSNGCRVALDSLKNWSAGKNNAGYYWDINTGQYVITDLASNSVDTFVGLECPGALNGSSEVISKALVNGNKALAYFQNKGQTHISGKEFAGQLGLPWARQWPPHLISLNLASQFKEIATSSDDKQPGLGVDINRVYLIAGNKAPISHSPKTGNDGIVPLEDMRAINSSVSYNQGELKIFEEAHAFLIDNKEIKNYIKNKLGD